MNATHAIEAPSTLFERVNSIDLHRLILLHVSRAAVISLTLLVAGERLPFSFASSWGWSEMVIAVIALVAAALTPVETNVHRRFILTWNTIGLIDLLVGIVAAAWMNLLEPGAIAALFASPLFLLPMIFIPLFIASHVAIYMQMNGGEQKHAWDDEPVETPPVGARIRYW